jgi:histidinol-phosphate aminotransferase
MGHVSFAALAVPGVRGLQPYVPGKPVEELERELGLSGSLKLASNENPLGPPPGAVAAARAAAAELGWYPDGSAWALKQAIARRLAVDPAQVTVGNGSNDVLVLLAEAFLAPGLEAVYSEYAFLLYGLIIGASGATARVAPALPAGQPGELGHDLAAMRERVGPSTRIVFIANPNNPTGTWLTATALRGFVESLPPEVLVVVDEAYCEYVSTPDYPDCSRWLAEFPNLVVTRTFSKAYGLAGLRIGYALSHPDVAELLNRIRQPFNVSLPGQRAAIAALADDDHLRRSRELNDHGLEQLANGLRELGFRPLPSLGNFLLVEVGDCAGTLYQGLLRQGVIVRPVANYGLPRHLRITTGLPEQNRRLLDALAQLARS